MNPYEILGVSENATDEEVKSAYKNLARKYHPDNYNDSPLEDVAHKKMQEINDAYDKICDMLTSQEDGLKVDISLGKCPECGAPLILNNVYAEKYNENGYLPDWQIYTKWLQGTLNKKLLILELGVGMQFPSVIRFPFEKIAFYNNKAEFYRVNEKLYHLTEELKDKGKAISENAIDWLLSL